MASIVVAGDTSGTVTLAAPAVSGTTTLTLPTTSGTVLTSASTITPSAGTVNQAALVTGVAGTGPAFIVYATTATSCTAGVNTKITFNVEEYDTNSNFASSRFTPTVAGYYQISGGVGVNTTPTSVYTIVYKNGSAYNGQYTTSTTIQASVSTLVYLNGSTDYVELYANFGATQNNYVGDRTQTYFQGFLARAA